MDGVIYIKKQRQIYDDDQVDIFMEHYLHGQSYIYIKQRHIYDDNKIDVFMDHYQF